MEIPTNIWRSCQITSRIYSTFLSPFWESCVPTRKLPSTEPSKMKGGCCQGLPVVIMTATHFAIDQSSYIRAKWQTISSGSVWLWEAFQILLVSTGPSYGQAVCHVTNFAFWVQARKF